MSTTSRPLLALLLLLIVPRPATATQILAMDIATLGRTSDAVVQGRVVDQRCFWNSAHTRIVTAVEIEVEQVHKGTTPPIVTVIQPGGELDGLRTTVHGMMPWRDGEEVLVFLESRPDGDHRVTGFTQGRFTIETDPETGQRVVTRSMPGVELIGAPDDGTLRLPIDRLLERANLRIREELR